MRHKSRIIGLIQKEAGNIIDELFINGPCKPYD